MARTDSQAAWASLPERPSGPLTLTRSWAELDGEDESILAPDPRLRRAAEKFREFLDALELDARDPNLLGTEYRVARAYRELFAGHYAGAPPVLRTFPNTERYADPVSVLEIPFYSLCAHHFLPFFGVAHVGYLPRERLLGLSKLARVVEHYARRPQLQERLTEQIAALLQERLEPAGVMVMVEARHLCMEMRGVGKSGLFTTTTAARGVFRDNALVRERFLSQLPRTGVGGR